MSNNKENDQNKEKEGFFSRIFGTSKGKGCCNVRIVPKEEPTELEKDEPSGRGEEKNSKEP